MCVLIDDAYPLSISFYVINDVISLYIFCVTSTIKQKTFYSVQRWPTSCVKYIRLNVSTLHLGQSVKVYRTT